MSIRWTRSRVIRSGQFLEAVTWAKDISTYVEKKFGIAKVETWIDVFGQTGTMRLTIDFPDLASVEKLQAQMMTDPDYWKYIERAAKSELFIDGTSSDVVSRSIDR